MSSDKSAYLKTCYRCDAPLPGELIDSEDTLGGFCGACDDCRLRITAADEMIKDATRLADVRDGT